MADIENALHPLMPDPEIAWMQKRQVPQTWGITIHRYRVGAPITLNVRDLAPTSRDIRTAMQRPDIDRGAYNEKDGPRSLREPRGRGHSFRGR